MSDLRRVGLCLALLAGVAIPARAQDAAEYRRRVRVLEQEYDRAIAEENKRDSILRAKVDTIRAGHLWIITPPDLVPLSRAAVDLAWPPVERVFGDESALLEEHPLVALRARDEGMYRELKFAYPGSRVVMLAPEMEPDIAAAALSSAASMIMSERNADLEHWNSWAISAGADWSQVKTEAFTDLVTTPSIAARDCVLGRIRACGEGLDIYPVADPLTQMFSPEDLRAIVGRRTSLRWGGRVKDYDRCVVENVTDACRELLRSQGRFIAPLRLGARLSLIYVALERGGVGAYGRWVHTPGTIADRLSAAAKMPTDSLLGVWRAELFATRGGPVTMSLATGLTTLGWIFILGLLASRSSRWR